MEPWQPLSIGGWVAVAAYALTIPLCILAFRGASPRAIRLWASIAGVLAFLGFLRAFNLTSDLTAFFRGVARDERWYSGRRPLQFAAVVLIGGALAAAAWILRRLRDEPRELSRAIQAVLVLIGLFGVRIVSFHQTDRVLNFGIAGLHVNGLVEVAALAAVAICAWRVSRSVEELPLPRLAPTTARIAVPPHRPASSGERPAARNWSKDPQDPSNSRPGAPLY